MGVASIDASNLLLVGVNGKTSFYRGRVSISKRYSDCINSLISLWKEQNTIPEPITTPVKCHIVLKGYNRFDIDSFIKPIFDSAERAGILHNDRIITELSVLKIRQKEQRLTVSFSKITDD